jgi:hypothetical protein
MIQAQSEKTYLKVGKCPYCGNAKTFTTHQKYIEQMKLDRMAFADCTCPDARADREQRAKIAEHFRSEGQYELARQVTG